MERIIKKIFSESGFADSEPLSETIFFKKKQDNQQEYFLIEFVNAENLIDYFESDVFDSVISDFEKVQQKAPDVQKNTSLIICVELEELDPISFEKYKKFIWQIEENEYWFKKNIVLYDQYSVGYFNQSSSVLSQLTKVVQNENLFDDFKDDFFTNSFYYLAIQLFIKIPFLNIPIREEEFENIETILKRSLTDKQLRLVSKIDDSKIESLNSIKEEFLDVDSKIADEYLTDFREEDETE